MKDRGNIDWNGQATETLLTVGAYEEFISIEGYDILLEPERNNTSTLGTLAWCGAKTAAEASGRELPAPDVRVFKAKLGVRELMDWYRDMFGGVEAPEAEKKTGRG